MKLRFVLSVVSFLAFSVLSRGENEIGFIERFALAADREKALNELVPGTEDYYFFHALHYQTTRQSPKLTAILDQWRKRNPGSPQRKVIENREALLAYDADPERTLAFLRDHFRLRFDHVQDARDQKPDLPTQLDPAQVSHAVFVREALTDDDLGKCSEEALAQLVLEKTPLRPAQRRALLTRLQRPNIPGLIELIAEDLRTSESRGFGEHPIHRLLLPSQLDHLQKLRPEIAGQGAFVFARLRHLAPGVEEDVEFDPAAREAWLERTWNYARALPATFNSLKAALLYWRLDHDRKKGIYDGERFVEYLKLPRRVLYAAPRWVERLENARTTWVNLNETFADASLPQPAIGNDEPLVRDYFLHLFESKPKQGWERFAEWVHDKWLKPVFAEALLVRGLGDREQLASLLSPAEFQRLNDRVDLEFVSTSPQFLAPSDEVNLELEVKNAPKLIVKVYELNALNYFLANRRQLNTDLPLDGLVANAETTHAYDEPPIRRARRTFNFPELKGSRGAWIIEFIGGGRSSRALVRKGQWHLVQRTGAGGDLLTVLDEDYQPVSDAVVWLDGREFRPRPHEGADVKKTAEILIPFTAEPTRKPIILANSAGTFATLTEFEHHAESYALDAAFFVDREQLIAGKEATIVIRPTLRLHEALLPLELLRDPKISITTATLDGIPTTREIKDVKLDVTRAYTLRLPVPERLSVVDVILGGKVEQLSKNGEKLAVQASDSWKINGIDRTAATFDGHLSRVPDGYVFDLLGKNAEPITDRQVIFDFRHELYAKPVHVPLRTDERGRIRLGKLAQIHEIAAQLPDGRRRNWHLELAKRTTDDELQFTANQPFEIPLQKPAKPGSFALLEIRAGGYVAELTDKITAPDADAKHLSILGLAPGDYTLLLPTEQRTIRLKVTAGAQAKGWAFGSARFLQLSPPKPLRIARVDVDERQLVVRVANVNPFTRVHVAAERFQSTEKDLFTLGGLTRFGRSEERPAKLPNLFAAGRDIGDEYRYILERRYAAKFPGNMLTRPGLLLNPWEKRTTDQAALGQRAMQLPPGTSGGRMRAATEAKAEKDQRLVAESTPTLEEASLDFLANAAPVYIDLFPDANGVVRIERTKLGDRSMVQVLATDLREADWRQIVLPEVPTQLRDLRLTRNLDPSKAFAEKKRFTALVSGQKLTLADRRTSELESYETIGSVFALYQTLSHDATLPKFAWILDWPALEETEKRKKYSEYACHELNVFLARKDPAFFATVVKPYLANKKDKTFIDDYLLGTDLVRYLEPWRFGQLNAAERALLATALKAEAQNIARHLRERWELLPPNPEAQDRLFETALRGRAMEEGERAAGALSAAKDIPALAAPVPVQPTPPPSASAPKSRLPGTAGQMFAGKALRQEAAAADAPAADAGNVPSLEGQLITLDDAGRQIADARAHAYYRRLGPTKEWAENNYYYLPIQQQGPDLITVNAFWRDYAQWAADGAQGPFLSTHFAEAHHSFAEMMLALAVLDLPFEAPKHETKTEGPAFTLTAGGSVILVHKEVLPAAAAEKGAELLVSQNFYRHGDRYRTEGNEKFDKYVTDEFLAGAVYAANIVVTNPTSSPQKLELLLQIPKGGLPVLGSKATDSRRVRLQPFTTQSFEYAFYFPLPSGPGERFPHYPVQVAREEKIVGAAKPFGFWVVAQLAAVDKGSWDYVSQYGTEAEVFAFLDQANIERLNLDRVAWRCRQNPDFYRRLVALLGARHRFDPVIYSYAIAQRDPAGIRQWLLHRSELASLCGEWFESTLLRFDPIERRSFEHLEYWPLVNQRAHRLGSEHRIANNIVLAQYRTFLTQLAHKPRLDAVDSLAIVGFLLLQDRVEEALARFKTINADALPNRLQYDYFRCYAGMYESDLAAARGIANQYTSHPIERWRNLFRGVITQLDEIEGKAPVVKGDSGQPDRERDTASLASTQPTFDFEVENRTISLTWRNLSELTANYYLVDPEFSFSSNPFVSGNSSGLSVVRPTRTARVTLPAGKDAMGIPLPPEFARANVLVEIVGAGRRKAHVYHSNTLALTMAENYGRLDVREQDSGKPLPKAYVKVYARLRGGAVRFFKDGYTDLRGRFDYASLNSGERGGPIRPLPQPATAALSTQMLRPGELDQVERLSVLVLSEAHGAVVREADPPRE